MGLRYAVSNIGTGWVAKDGGLGGYSGGVAEKDYLLRLESSANRGGYLT